MSDSSDQPDVSDDRKPDVEVMTLASFLETKPPGVNIKISDLFSPEIRNTNKYAPWQINTPRLTLHCDDTECDGLRHFRFVAGDRQPKDSKRLLTYLTYVCSNCRRSTKVYSLNAAAESENDEVGLCYKYGEMPPFGPSTPPRLLKLFEHNRDLFMKGRRCESQGLGVGAFVYYRRVVEDQRTAIIGEIIRVAKLINAPAETLASLESARKETQFSKSLDMIKDAIPESLRIQGHNPMTLLHDSLSTGLHAQTDVECLEIAQAIRVVLAELAERLTNALKDEAELTKALGKLLNKPKPPARAVSPKQQIEGRPAKGNA
ncbi:hypothetical protein [Bradyrhizobium erythrophlei]|uniref:Uncharacterized protein n=1 Tax=Bradyrhizobium erythrophlei TaxID=1437360 RepID=A0A1M7UVH4_9BRAD|nr:hypothetical protein [Bradyrhizobium erythrophlei]SHN86950.1 hypothetical protein SAMN05444170_6934 [Bradyrhizobium erythrophlei]